MSSFSDALGNWVKGTDRICWNCKEPIKNLQTDLGGYRRVWPGGKTQVMCRDCHVSRPEAREARKRS